MLFIVEIAAGIVLGVIGLYVLLFAPFLIWDAFAEGFRRLGRPSKPTVQPRPAWADAKPRPADDEQFYPGGPLHR
jgi:hypothetical protein